MDIVISINKPEGYTSQDAVSKTKKILRVKKAGHTGTLDPMATGLLLVCVNRATRLSSYFSGLDKEYLAVMKLGETTDTQDATGKVVSICNFDKVDHASLMDILKSFEGKTLQQPPMFSALKHRGKPLYRLARKGIEIERKPREVNIHFIKPVDIQLPFVSFRTACSKGTYIRTLCDDIGKKLGVGAHLYKLERTRIGPFKNEDSLSFDELTSISRGDQINRGIYTIDEALSWMPEFRINDIFLKRVIHGHSVPVNSKSDLPPDVRSAPGIRIKSPDGDLLAVGSFSEIKNAIKMDVVFS